MDETFPSIRALLGDESKRACRLPGEARATAPSCVDHIGERHASVASLACRSTASCLAQIAANLDGARRGETEPLHQLRVGVRRLRTTATIGREAQLTPLTNRTRVDLRWLWALLGAVRDFDVFVSETWPAVEKRCGKRAPAGFDAVTASLRAATHARLLRAFRSQRFRKLMLALDTLRLRRLAEAADAGRDEAAADDARRLARRLLARRARRVRRRSKAIRHLSDKKLHALRIEAKRLRYLGESFASLHEAAAAERYLHRVAAIQSVLGRMNDLVVGEHLVWQITAPLSGPSRRAARSHYRAYGTAMKRKLRRRLERAVSRFCESRPFWA